jgi:UDP-3-O-[3-hydroxymyristoyl] glucosamine N-acyltransferase
VRPHYTRIVYATKNFFARRTKLYWTVFKNEISDKAQIHPTAHISPKGVRIGDSCRIGPHVIILQKSVIEQGVIIGAGSVISSEGFVFRRFGDKIMPIVHVGGVHIHRGAVIGSNTCVDKATARKLTEIGEESRIGDCVHVAHDVGIGKKCRIDSHVMIAGHVVTGDSVHMGANASITDSISIGGNVDIAAGAVVTRDVPNNANISGNFAISTEKHRGLVSAIAQGRTVG